MTTQLLPEAEEELCNKSNVLDPNTWPTDLSVEYGELELNSIII